MEKKTLDEYVKTFTSCFKKLCKKEMEKGKGKEGDVLKREARLLDLRYRLSLDLRVGIETEYSSTKGNDVRETYELIFKFMDLWNVYEACQRYGQKLSVFPTEKDAPKKWDAAFLKNNGLVDCLEKQAESFKKQFLSTESNRQKYIKYLGHFAGLDAISKGNKKKYKKYINADVKAFDYEQLLFIQYMERNAFYHGGETAKSEVGYAYRKKLLKFYIDFLKQFIALLGVQLFTIDMTKQ